MPNSPKISSWDTLSQLLNDSQDGTIALVVGAGIHNFIDCYKVPQKHHQRVQALKSWRKLLEESIKLSPLVHSGIPSSLQLEFACIEDAKDVHAGSVQVNKSKQITDYLYHEKGSVPRIDAF